MYKNKWEVGNSYQENRIKFSNLLITYMYVDTLIKSQIVKN
jgi:hypothetical protein